MTACVGGESGVPSESISGPTIQLTADANSCVSKGEHSTMTTQQEDNGRTGESSNKINMECSADQIKGNTMINAHMG